MVRYYVPQGSATAGVPLPTIEAYDVRTGQSVALPEQYLLGGRSMALFGWIMRPIFTTIVDNKLRFYHSEGAGLFPNADNLYLIGAVTRRRGEVVVLRVKPPTFPKDTSEYGSTQVRYWSLNERNRDTSTAFGLRDDQFKVASDGFVYVAIGDKGIRQTGREARLQLHALAHQRADRRHHLQEPGHGPLLRGQYAGGAGDAGAAPPFE